MSNPVLLKIEDPITLVSFASDSSVRLKFHQNIKGKRFYRLKCTASSYSTGFPTTYLYLGSYETDPSWDYIVTFPIASVKNSSLTNTSFEALFTRFPDTATLRVYAALQSSATSNFSAYDTSGETPLLDIRLSGSAFVPEWTVPTWYDTKYANNEGVRTLTGSNQKGVQGVSRFHFHFAQAAGRYGASVDKYIISIAGAYTHTLTPSQAEGFSADYLDLSVYYKLVGAVKVTFTVEDTRGMRTSFTRSVSVFPYKTLSLTNNDTHRQGGTGSTVILDFSGTWHGNPLTLTCTEITAKEEGSSAAFASLTPEITVSGTLFSYKAVWSGVTFDPQKAYTITATFTDTVKTFAFVWTVPVGTPVLSIRDKKIGINNPSPSRALDVSGIIAGNGYPVLGYTGLIGLSESANLNDYTDTGYYIYKAGDSRDVSNFPGGNVNTHLLMMVICAKGYNDMKYGVQKAWWPTTGDEFMRTFYGGSFTAWKKVTVT